ncbi:MAG: L-histidine N(alpha)-methyltransferase [Thermosynechococcaceae cyanobacterium]
MSISQPVDSQSSPSSPQSLDARLSLQHLAPAEGDLTVDGADVIAGLSQTPKTLPPKYFYDDRGSELFEKICDLTEYYVTRTETQILQTAAADMAQMTGSCELVELGSGSSTKTRLLLDAYRDLQVSLDAPESFHYTPIDVSGGILKESATELLRQYPSLHIRGLIGTYAQGLQQLPKAIAAKRMICFLGSTLGNLSPTECEQFFAQVRGALQPGDYFLLGVDLQKSIPILEAAYNDAQGVTAAFNLNMLQHLNWRFQANFNLNQFEHWSFYNDQQQQIEMHLRSLCNQTVDLGTLHQTIPFMEGETIRTEISRKFNLEQLSALLEPHSGSKGFISVQVWTDPKQWFGLLLCQAVLDR